MTGLIDAKSAKLWRHNPAAFINSHQQRQDYLHKHMIAAVTHRLEQFNQRLLNSSQTLHAISPLATLNRGYALAIHPSSGEIIRTTERLKLDDMVETRLAHGRFTSQIKVIDGG
jgi:exodeoxyribonuclease VII large subunit